MKFKVLIGLIFAGVAVSLCESKTWSDEDTIFVEVLPGSASKDDELKTQYPIGIGGQYPRPGIGSYPQYPQYPGGFPGYPPTGPAGGIRPTWPGAGGIISCYAANGDAGECATLRQCYPFVYSYETGREDEIADLALAEVLTESSGLCPIPESESYNASTRADAETRQHTTIICCTSKNPKPPVTPPHARPPTARPPVVGTTPGTQQPVTQFPATQSPVTQPEGTQSPVTHPPESQKDSSCGRRKLPFDRSDVDEGVPAVTLVVGDGVSSKRGKHPWIAALTTNGRQFCGGSLIDSHHVLTAAHCIQHMNANDVAKLRVELGKHEIGKVEQMEQKLKVTKLLYHREFTMQTLHSDIAILKLATPATESDYVQKACLATDPKQDYDNKLVELAGWGQISEGGPLSKVLREAEIQVLPQQACKSKYSGTSAPAIAPSMLCASLNGKDACRGDSGGPLVLNDPTSQVATQIGLVSWGIGCGRYPGVYSRVSHFSTWIEKNTKH